MSQKHLDFIVNALNKGAESPLSMGACCAEFCVPVSDVLAMPDDLQPVPEMSYDPFTVCADQVGVYTHTLSHVEVIITTNIAGHDCLACFQFTQP